ncbi:hypothetical protein RAS1_32380 [Phycisphaerae bacterium RAS1]|nr:hypothetical protein RAS1_32380 [Phycisphaerae bacterium RAS1]
MFDPTRRFSARVADYVAHRPGYPRECAETLAQEFSLKPASIVADIGCGPGNLAIRFLELGHHVISIEPNDEMRTAGEALLAPWSTFRAVAGRAEATTLPDVSVDAVVVGQAFHWFDQSATRSEFARILRPGGPVGLYWNNRRLDSSAFLSGYETLLRRLCPEYVKISGEYANEQKIAVFFGPSGYRRWRFDNVQHFDWDGLLGRTRSASYVPREGPAVAALTTELRRLFDSTSREGRVAFEYDTLLFAGRLAGEFRVASSK